MPRSRPRTATRSLGAGLALLVAACSSDDRCSSPPPAPPAGLCDSIELDDRIPPDVEADPSSLDVDDAQQMFDCLAWQTFVALNWPARDGCRGVPASDAPFSRSTGERVWETYKETYEVFQSQDPSWNPSAQRWNDEQPATQCSSLAHGRKVLLLTAKTPFGRDVDTEVDQAFAGFGAAIDQAGRPAYYEVRFNRDVFEYLRDGGFAITGRYGYGGPPPSAGSVVFPDDRNGATGAGSIEVKAAWKELGRDDDATRYYAQEVILFDDTQSPVCRVATMGLVGLHVTRKTHYAPQRAWATFEHVDNTPPFGATRDDGRYSFFNASCTPAAPANCWSLGTSIETADQVCCPNAEVPQTQYPGVPTQLTRLDPVTAPDLNRRYREHLAAAGSPFQYYELIGTQWPRGGRSASGTPSRPCNPNGPWRIPPAGDQPCFEMVPAHLRNTTMESFMATYAAGAVQESSDSCLNCHAAAGVDMSYLWLEAATEPVPIER
jgi:hypothetical protein